jgi:pseudoazurin
MRAILFAAALLLGATPAIGAEHVVKMLNQGTDGMMVFEPGYLKVAPGDSVTFVPTDAGHNSSSALVPEGATGWQGTFGAPLTVKLDKEGVYVFQCDPHVMMAMVGVIQVGEAKNAAAAKTKAGAMKAGFVMAQDRLDTYLGRVK